MFLMTLSPGVLGQGIDDVTWRGNSGENPVSAVPSKDALRDNVVVLSFWSLRCSPCLKALARIDGIAKEYTGRKVVFLWLNTHDEPQEAIDSLMKTRGHITFVFDSVKTTWKKFGEPAWGRLLLFNRKGELAWKGETHEFTSAILETVVRFDRPVSREHFFVNMHVERAVELTETEWSVEQSEKETKILLRNMNACDLLKKLYKLAYGSDDHVAFENVPETTMLYNVEISLSSTKLLSRSLKQAVAQMAGLFNIAIVRSSHNGKATARFDFKEYLELQK